MDTVRLNVEGMSCGGCVVSVEKALHRVAGVGDVKVSLADKEAVVTGEKLDTTRLIAAVEDAGYEASPR